MKWSLKMKVKKKTSAHVKKSEILGISQQVSVIQFDCLLKFFFVTMITKIFIPRVFFHVIWASLKTKI